MTKETVYILGAGFSRAIGVCKKENREFLPPLDTDFFCALEEEKLLSELLADKPCLTHLLHWMGIYDKFGGELKQRDYSLEKFWTQINLMLKLNSSITGFPDFGLLSTQKHIVNGKEFESLPNLDGWASTMSHDEGLLYRFLSGLTENFFNYEGLTLLLAEYELKKSIFQVYSEMDYQEAKGETIIKFKEIVGDSPIISFNYDCLVEKAFDKHVLFSYDDRISLKNTKPLIIKPHGSLAWTVTKRYYQQEGTIELMKRLIRREPQTSSFQSKNYGDSELESSAPIIIPMSLGKENFVSSLDTARIEICNDNALNKKREFIDCVVSYAKMLEAIRQAERLVFIGYSFPPTDYESVILLDLASSSSARKEYHICIKGDKIPNPDISCRKLIFYKEGFEHFVEDFIPEEMTI